MFDVTLELKEQVWDLVYLPLNSIYIYHEL